MLLIPIILPTQSGWVMENLIICRSKLESFTLMQIEIHVLQTLVNINDTYTHSVRHLS